jgi:hypothetical protein
MKKFLCLLSLATINTFILLSQSSEHELSNAEIFCNKPEGLVEKQYIEIGNVDLIDLKLMKCHSITKGDKVNALRFEFNTANQVISQTKLAFVDEDEITGLTNAVKVIIDNLSLKKENYTEMTFVCRSGFVAGAYYNPNNQKWITFMQMNKMDTKSTVPVPKDEFTAFLKLLEKSSSLLNIK